METQLLWVADDTDILILLLYHWHNMRAVYLLTQRKEPGASKGSNLSQAMGDWQTRFKFQLLRPVVCTCMVWVCHNTSII